MLSILDDLSNALFPYKSGLKDVMKFLIILTSEIFLKKLLKRVEISVK